MRLSKLFARPAAVHAVVASLLFAAAAVAVQEDGDAPAQTPAGKPAKVVKPYSLLEDLTPEQELEIGMIRRDVLDRMSALRAEEKERVEAVLTAEQLDRLEEIRREEREAANDRRRARREAEQNGEGEEDAGGDDE